MTLSDLGRRFGTWLGVEPEDAEPHGAESCYDGLRHSSAREPAAPSSGLEREIAELHRLIAELTSGLDRDHDA